MLSIMQISVIIAYKPVSIGNLLLPGGVIGFPLVFTISDVVAEVFGYKHARRMLWQSVIFCTLFSLTIIAILHMPSPESWGYRSDYNVVFNNLPRVLLSVIFGITASSFLNIYLVSHWKVLLYGKYFFLRSFIASSIGEIIITIIADLTAFLGTLPNKQFWHLVISVYLFKIVYSCIASCIAAKLTIYLKSKQDTEIYDVGIKFNPFSLKI